jgi:hypothetical protein
MCANQKVLDAAANAAPFAIFEIHVSVETSDNGLMVVDGQSSTSDHSPLALMHQRKLLRPLEKPSAGALQEQ